MKEYKSINGFNCIPDDFPIRNGKVSNCCSADIYGEGDICPACKEHCQAMKECKTCKGKGVIEFKNGLKLFCTICGGEGMVEDE